MAIVYFILAIIFLLYIRVEEKTFFVPSSIIVLTWCIFPGIASLHPLGLYEFSDYTQFIILLSFFTFMIVYYGLRAKSPSFRSIQITPYSSTTGNSINYKFLILSNIVIMFWIFPKTIESWVNIQLMGWDGVRAQSEELFGTTAMNLAYLFFAKPLVIASLALFAAELFRNPKFNFTRILFILFMLINVLQETVIFAARATLVKVIIYVLFAFFFLGKNTQRIGKSKNSNTKWFFILAIVLYLVFQVLAFVTAGRNEGNERGLLDTFTIYYVAPFGVLNYYVEHPDYSLLNFDDMTYGTCMMGFLYNIFYFAYAIFLGAPYKGTDFIINQIAGEDVYVAPSVHMNAACTANYCFLKDFGIFGVVIGFTAMAYLILKVRSKYNQTPSVRNGAVYIYVLYVVFRLSSSWDFLSPSAFFALFYIWLGTAQKSDFLRLLGLRTHRNLSVR